jgi:membrane protein DedA with SNARE-associated domain
MFMIDQAHLIPLILHYGLLIAASLIFIGQLGVPIGVPAELVLLLVGGYAVQSLPALLEGLLLVMLADVLGSSALFLLTRRGSGICRKRLAEPRHGDNGMPSPWWYDRLQKRGVIFLVRALPLVRIYGAVGSGLLRTRTRDYLAAAVPAGLLWAGTPLTLGYLFREHVASIVAGYPTGLLSIAAIVPGLLVTALVALRLRGRSANGRTSPWRNSAPQKAPQPFVATGQWRLPNCLAMPAVAPRPVPVFARDPRLGLISGDYRRPVP